MTCWVCGEPGGTGVKEQVRSRLIKGLEIGLTVRGRDPFHLHPYRAHYGCAQRALAWIEWKKRQVMGAAQPPGSQMDSQQAPRTDDATRATPSSIGDYI